MNCVCNSVAYRCFLFVYLYLVEPSIPTLSEYQKLITASGLNLVIGLPPSLIWEHADSRRRLIKLLKSDFARAIQENLFSASAFVNGVQSKTFDNPYKVFLVGA